eukprot:c27577_g2_i1 orf=250-501(+)
MWILRIQTFKTVCTFRHFPEPLQTISNLGSGQISSMIHANLAPSHIPLTLSMHQEIVSKWLIKKELPYKTPKMIELLLSTACQ